VFYYQVSILNSNAPILTYSYNSSLNRGDVVKVSLKNSIKKAVILEEVDKPDFDTLDILEKDDFYFSKEQLEIANFIKDYYFSSYGEAIGLFHPLKNKYTSINNSKIKELPTLSTLQENALKQIEKEQISLLFGVTGSGKTEIYIHLINNVLNEGKSAIILMPEIALTPQITKRIEKYFGECVASWHSKLSKKRREETLEKIYSGEIKIIIGARSALFLPIQNIGLIVVDEEHDDSYKSMSRPRYNAKDLSIYMAKKLDIKVVLGSATPLITSYYKFPTIKIKKPYKESKKEFKFIPGQEINYEILREIDNVVSKNEQALIFVPTRANFKYLICQDCGKTHTCPYCSIGMSIHSKKRVMQCHYCNFTQKISTNCTFCGSQNLITQRVGTAEVAELIKQNIKSAKIEQFDRDTITTANKLYKALQRVQNKESNVIVGTQMLSKGHDYPEITLIVITGLDFIMANSDYRAKERAIALLHQIAGRGGRTKDAKVIIQTSQKELYKPYIKDYEIFIDEELQFRKELYPPFRYLARILISNKDYNIANSLTTQIVQELDRFSNIQIVGYGVAPIEKIANRWRFNILLRSSKRVELLKALHIIKKDRNIEIDMDPVDFT